jgi:uncharacterized protein YecE (DUF72 family)
MSEGARSLEPTNRCGKSLGLKSLAKSGLAYRHHSARGRKRPARGDIARPERISDRLAPKRRRRDVFVFFDNDAKVRAPFDALGLIERVERRLGAKLD